MPPLYEKIQNLCRDKGINITVLCTACAIPRASLSDFKNGRQKTLSAETISKIAEYFDVSVEYLCGKSAPAASKDALKVALFGGDAVVTDEMWEEVRRYAQFVKERQNGNQ